MKSQLEGFERLTRNDEFAVYDKAFSLQSGEAGDHLREEAVERPLVLGLEIDLVAVAECQAAEAVIFRLIKPLSVRRQAI